jgi:hypothetical protein
MIELAAAAEAMKVKKLLLIKIGAHKLFFDNIRGGVELSDNQNCNYFTFNNNLNKQSTIKNLEV